MKLLVKMDDDGGRLIALAPPPGQEPRPFLRLHSLAAHMLAMELAYPLSCSVWVEVPCESVAKEQWVVGHFGF